MGSYNKINKKVSITFIKCSYVLSRTQSGGDTGIDGAWVSKGQGMEGARLWRGHGYGREIGMQGILVWRGHGFGGDKGTEGTGVWKGHGYGEDKGMEVIWGWMGQG